VHSPCQDQCVSQWREDQVTRLIFAGDPKRGIAACSACHGPGAYRLGAPSLSKQNAAYMEQQLHNFAQGLRANDMNMPMRTIAGMLSGEEMDALALAYSSEAPLENQLKRDGCIPSGESEEEHDDKNRNQPGLAIRPIYTSVGTQDRKKSVGSEMVSADTPYSPGVLVGDTLYISGLQGTDPQTHTLPKNFGQEANNCLTNVGTVLKDSGLDYSNVVSVQIYLADMSQFQEVNSLYKEYFKAPFPSRTTVQVTGLSSGAHIEIAAIARK
jgi:reactive intermediate/imine deaminase